jgi:hypothetical protein
LLHLLLLPQSQQAPLFIVSEQINKERDIRKNIQICRHHNIQITQQIEQPKAPMPAQQVPPAQNKSGKKKQKPKNLLYFIFFVT